MRAVLTKEEADILIDNIQDIEELWVSNDKLREEKYKETMKSCECKDWMYPIYYYFTPKNGLPLIFFQFSSFL